MSHADRNSRGGPWKLMLFLVLLGTVGGIVLADMWIRRNQDTFEQSILGGMFVAVLGIGYSWVIKNPSRFLMILVGGAGLGWLLRGFAAML